MQTYVCMCMCVVSTRFVLSDYFDAISDVCVYMWVFSPLSCLRVLANRLHMIASLRVLPDRLLIPTAQDGVMVRFAIPPAHCSVDLACVYVHVMTYIYIYIYMFVLCGPSWRAAWASLALPSNPAGVPLGRAGPFMSSVRPLSHVRSGHVRLKRKSRPALLTKRTVGVGSEPSRPLDRAAMEHQMAMVRGMIVNLSAAVTPKLSELQTATARNQHDIQQACRMAEEARDAISILSIALVGFLRLMGAQAGVVPVMPA